jgi:hypothetical protein
MDPMTKMWVSFVAIGLMVLASLVITFARAKTKGAIRFVLTLFAFILLLLSLLYGFISIV